MATPIDVPTTTAARGKTVPFDYAFRFPFVGTRSTLKNTVTVSVEGSFHLVSIGFGFIPDTDIARFGLPSPSTGAAIRNVMFGSPVFAASPNPTNLSTTSLEHVLIGAAEAAADAGPGVRANLLLEALTRPIRLNPEVAAELVADPARPIRASQQSRLFEVALGPKDIEIQFLYGLFDDGSGREFQSEPILSTAGLGISNGDRPFRRFPVPLVFEPRSVIRMDVTPVSDIRGELHVALHGYKALQTARATTGGLRRDQRARRREGRRRR